MIFLKKIRARIQAWKQNEEGSLSIETLFMVPLLVWALLATTVYFDAYRTKFLHTKATSAIADMLSRETYLISDEYLEGLFDIFKALVGDQTTPLLYVAVYERNDDNNSIDLVWSKYILYYGAMDYLASGNDLYFDYSDIVPIMADEERIIVVRSDTSYEVPYAATSIALLDDITFSITLVISPRFSSTLCYNAAGDAEIGTTSC
jgi:hypothetical protein